jgi:hypothetical protein
MRPAVHLHDLLGDGEAESSPALGLGVGAVDLVKLLENARLALLGYPRTRVSHAHNKVAVVSSRSDAQLAGIGERDGVADQIEQHLGEALLVTETNG